MSLLTSLLNLTVVVAAGWFTIYYIIPKIESGELGLGLPGIGGGSGTKNEEQQIPEDIAGAANGDEPEPPPPEEEEKPKKGTKSKKGKGEWLSGDKTGKDNRKKKPEAKKEFRIIEYLVEMGY